jgi:alkylhydroperoxidase/carboxymuconolactone decarboxylase family protein YurZ
MMRKTASDDAARATDSRPPIEPARASKPDTPFCDRLKATDNWNSGWDPFYELDPVWTEKFLDMGVSPMLSGVLDAKTVEFLAIAVDASCTHMYAPGVRRHIRKALELGATREEITAVLQCVSVLGIHTMSLGAPILQEEIAFARQREGSPTGLDAGV